MSVKSNQLKNALGCGSSVAVDSQRELLGDNWDESSGRGFKFVVVETI